jgi:transmembrane sensor
MRNSKTQFRELGATVAQTQDRILQSRSCLAEVYDNLSFTREAYPRKITVWQKHRPQIIFAGAVAVALTVAFLVLLEDKEPQLEAYHGKQKIAEGSWISSDVGKPLSLSFTDGSRVSLAQMGSARIQELNPSGAHIVVERGSIDAAIKHTRQTNWDFSIGPYQIHVTGTRFRVSWDAAEKKLNLQMKEGSVNVSGPMISHYKTVSAGETLNASLTRGKLEFFAAQNLSGSDLTRKAKSASPISSITESGATKMSAPSSARQRRRPSSEWLADAKSGRYDEAVQKARASGIAHILKNGRSGDLLLLGDAARHSGNLGFAEKMYHHVQKKFGGSAAAGNATFAMGVMAFHQQHDYRAAARWFGQCLSQDDESAGLRREALGRLIEVYRRTGQKEMARKYADTYLETYPRGPHAALARKVLK